MSVEDPASAAARLAASFGFEEIAPEEKAGRVKAVFERVAARYDLMNDLMSAGIHRLWKEAMLDWLAPRPGMHLLDVAGGTGDVALRFLSRVRGEGRVTVVDYNFAMVEVGRDRALDAGWLAEIDWVVGDAQCLPLPDASVEAYTIAFGIRNVTRIDRALAEARRVLKPGGRFLCLEFSKLSLPLLEPLYDLYSFTVLPALGGLVAGDAESYRYLAESIRRFPDQRTFAALVEAAGLERVRYRNLSGGIAAIHSAWRL
ncbi:MAG: bifunctional demethylmenaquinone methyltransferase/2-methoxy-6-polyprenyl-1,4-benzoquinol methylase UbiE [Geminicoccaceae bacterium]|nr:bifunctional demethylmenaquinone methyltransferase/2-methoxy-6-polyprenyl-1,4-benzoquinol methylase UbiE [Geminicoccaceae bacterium]MCS7267752.1 bifunctional demethylmenaquinone methyltransferase/2-methoxy-6-polyprenyl-1,4-benzoquinol methylase UbiE [Geminicoccaceae bacterium]MCX7628923.1 bifunctional demethylmenaquinone methyltransferase/2-methoxy-6-polyprenyl-1,4-benzoquinol methylase UbiE [Geminicoccaceae bacterium]MDW8124306.1 bifunctional demethylmenaquinone methyltransferase/2-methoxy-6